MLVNRSKTILQYWQVDGKRWPNLQKLAMKVYSMATSSASAERNFSTFGFVHSKLWNQLDPETVKKLSSITVLSFKTMSFMMMIQIAMILIMTKISSSIK